MIPKIFWFATPFSMHSVFAFKLSQVQYRDPRNTFLISKTSMKLLICSRKKRNRKLYSKEKNSGKIETTMGQKEIFHNSLLAVVQKVCTIHT